MKKDLLTNVRLKDEQLRPPSSYLDTQAYFVGWKDIM